MKWGERIILFIIYMGAVKNKSLEERIKMTKETNEMVKRNHNYFNARASFVYLGRTIYNSVLPITLPKGYDIPQFIGVFGKLCVTIYLFLSGYGFACKYAEKNQNLDIHKIGRSIVGIYRKYLLVFFIFFTIGLLIGKRTFNVKEWILNLIAFDTTYNKECWFLFIYILLLVIVLPLLYAGENKYTWKIRLIISFQ